MNPTRQSVEVGLTALTVLFGWQALRALLPLMAYLLRDRLGWNVGELLALALMLFAASFAAAPLRRRLGPRRLLVATAGGVGLLRLTLQVWTWDPLGELALAFAATALFFVFLPARLLDARVGGVAGTASFALGWLIGLALDTALHGAYGTYDLSWRPDVTSLLLTLVLVAGQCHLLTRAGAPDSPQPIASAARIWLAFGPFVFLQSLVFQNVARLTVLTGWSPTRAFGWVLASQVLGVAAALFALPRRGRLSPSGAALAGLVLVATQAIAWPRGPLAAFLLLAGQLLSAAWLALVLARIGEGTAARPRAAGPRAARPRAARDRLALSHGGAMVALLFFIYLYYAGFNVPLPLDNRALAPLAALAMAVAGFAAVRALPRRSPAAITVAAGGRLFAVVLPLMLLPLVRGLAALPAAADPPPAARVGGLPVRVMTYNVHCGFDVLGQLDLEAIARTIEAQDPDVVALQEVSRGWIVNGSADMLAWLAQRLGMRHVFAPAADPLWGNAVLSRLPILGHETRDLPGDFIMRRGLISVAVDAGGDRPLEVIATHFHHRRDGGAIRVEQARALLDFWQGRERTVVLGDLNGEPQHPEIELFRRAGLTDAFALAGAGPGYTFSARRPFKRIDYVWLSADLVASDVAVAPDKASDHLAVAATVGVKPSGG